MSYFAGVAGLVNPGLALVGLVVAVAAGCRAHLRPLVVVGSLASMGWGLAVAGLALRAGVGWFLVGKLRAIPSYVIGVLMGLCVRHVAITLAHSTSRRLAWSAADQNGRRSG